MTITSNNLELPEPSIVMEAIQYMVEPGFLECETILDRRLGGGLGTKWSVPVFV